ncbi:MAG: mechanosensitive ion channel family protein, partial [Dolichospermum sp.]
NIQDKCNEAGIEILSPHYSAVRDGNQTTIPENYLSEDYKAPGFRLSYLNNLFNPDNSKDTPDL